ncbi:hypothetical protein [Kushneria konosiri]|uniref:Uncharacterized protein n=1 Tax=Kushneria konosiri TaxID=698828 RepID=A0A2Z2HE25_9GAMM|nr:hypothetical protein [Kushneria konosiri]ARS51521.1 hypothetical protein B9G99_00235 [Kushneria konosiri]
MPLNRQHAEKLVEEILATAEILGQEMRATVVNVMVRDLREYEYSDVSQSLTRCRAELTGKLTLAAILERMQGANQFLSPNEAWALALTAQDELETVIWTAEVATAAGVAQPILDLGDKVGARMAFISAYEREVAAAKSERRQPEYMVSLGYSPERRQEAITQGVKKGLLAAPKVEHLLPAPHGFNEEKTGDPERDRKANEAIAGLRSLLRAPSEEKAQQREREEQRRQELIQQAEMNQYKRATA